MPAATATLAQLQHRGVQQFLHLTTSKQTADISALNRPVQGSPAAHAPFLGKQLKQRPQQYSKRPIPTKRASKLPAGGYWGNQPGQSQGRHINDGTQCLRLPMIADSHQDKASQVHDVMPC